MHPRELVAAQPRPHVVDVREDHEWAAGHIDGGQHIPLGQLAARLDEVPRGTPLVAVCKSGHRSGIAARGLSVRGIPAQNLDGGLEARTRDALPLVSSCGGPGRVVAP